jgi:hypothetical protein
LLAGVALLGCAQRFLKNPNTHAAPVPTPLSRRSDFESDDDQPKKPVPDWARGRNLQKQLEEQQVVDPDGVFQSRGECELDAVFPRGGSNKKGRGYEDQRGSTGDWGHDGLKRQEVLDYQREMGYAR